MSRLICFEEKKKKKKCFKMLSAAVVISALKLKLAMHHSFFFPREKKSIFAGDPLADNVHEILSLIFSEQLKYKYFRIVTAAVITHALTLSVPNFRRHLLSAFLFLQTIA